MRESSRLLYSLPKWGYFCSAVLLGCGTLDANRHQLDGPSVVPDLAEAAAAALGDDHGSEFLGQKDNWSPRDNPQQEARIRVDEAAFVETDDEVLDPLPTLMDGRTTSHKRGVLEKNREPNYRLKGISPFEKSVLDSTNHHHLLDQQMNSNSNSQNKFKPTLLSTGTTIAGVCGYDHDGKPFVVLGADTRATAGRMVADKRCQKIHCLAQNLWCCGAGTSADLDHITRQCRYSLALQSLSEKESIGNGAKHWKPHESTAYSSHLERTAEHFASMALACRFFRDVLYDSGGEVGANLIVGGVDEESGLPQIRAVHPGGSMDTLSYAALGSGGLAAMAVIESRFRNDITLQEGIQIVKEAILSGIQNDMGSGSQVDLCIITTRHESSSEGRGIKVQSNYTRAVVPEEELPENIRGGVEGEVNLLSDDNSSRSDSTPGVNGFGNYPYTVRSKRLVLQSRQQAEQDRLKKWNEFLGLKE